MAMKKIYGELQSLARKYKKMAKLIGRQSTTRQLLYRIEQLLCSISLLPKFKVLQVELYNGSQDLVNHFKNLKAYMILHNYPEEVAYWAFSLTLRGMARSQFRALKSRTISSFEELARQFLMQFLGSCKQRRMATYLLSINNKSMKA